MKNFSLKKWCLEILTIKKYINIGDAPGFEPKGHLYQVTILNVSFEVLHKTYDKVEKSHQPEKHFNPSPETKAGSKRFVDDIKSGAINGGYIDDPSNRVIKAKDECLFCSSRMCRERIVSTDGITYDEVACDEHEEQLYAHSDAMARGVMKHFIESAGKQYRGEKLSKESP